MASVLHLDKAASFVDDTSSNLSRQSGDRVSIHAQVLGESALEWFYRLVKKCPNDGRELKSNVLASTYFNLPSDERDSLIPSLRLVRIHVIDPQPYMQELRETIERILPGQTLESFLRRLEQAEKSLGVGMRRTLMESVASDMLRNSPYEQVKLRFGIMNLSAHISVDLEGIEDSDEGPEPAIDFSPFLNKSGHLVLDRVALFSSKAGPVFSSALDLMDDTLSSTGRGELPSVWMASIGIQRCLSVLHVFDEGNDEALRWVEERRSETVSFVDPFGIGKMLPPRSALASVDSKISPYIQAADVAAGIARALFENDIARLRATFEYVMHNGRQIGGTLP